MPTLRFGDLDLYYEDLGGPPDRTVIFLHGLLLSFEMMAPVARAFAGPFRPVLVEMHGHGRSSRPDDPASYSMETFGDDVLALADHLGVDRFGVFGTSLGADVGLEVMLDHPSRVAGAVLEMPVLDRGAKFARRAFKPLAAALRRRSAGRVLRVASGRMPNLKLFPGFADSLAYLANDPGSGAAVIEGLLAQAERSRWGDVDHCEVPAIVIAHTLDPLHTFGDARELSSRLPNGRLVRAHSVLELRMKPARIIGITKRFFERSFSATSDAEEDAG